MSPKREIRLLLADVDGTLVTKDKRLTDATRLAVQALGHAGIGLALTSARPPRGLATLIEPLQLRLPLAGFNGGVMVNPDFSVIESHPIDPANAKKTVAVLLGKGVDVWVYTDQAWFVRDPKALHVDRETWILGFDATVVPAFTDAQLDRAFKIVGVSDDAALLKAAADEAQAVLGDSVSATLSEAHFFDVTHPLANKGCVVTALAKILDIPAEAIATIGDMPNDVLMFRQSGFSIAMGNASDAVKAQASVVTDGNDDEGFAKAVQRFLLRTTAA